jgi:hypothetical protein
MDSKRMKVLWFFLSRKNFFFEKKKQKTFIRLVYPGGPGSAVEAC